MDPYILRQDSYEKEQHAFYETLFSLSNGYVGLRSTPEFESVFSLPGAFYYNLYDYGMSVPNHLINGPNWLDIKLHVEDEIINYDFCKILQFSRTLNMRDATVNIFIRFEDLQGRITEINYNYYIHASHRGSVIHGTVTSLNYNGRIRVEMAMNYQTGNSYHGGFYGTDVKSFQLEQVHSSFEDNACFLSLRTAGTQKQIHTASFIESEQAIKFVPIVNKMRTGTALIFDAHQQVSNSFTRYVSYDSDSNDQLTVRSCLAEMVQIGQGALFCEHQKQWAEKWKDNVIVIEGDDESYQGMIYGTFQLKQSMDCEALINIPARGLTSEYHHGHFFFNTDLYKAMYFCWNSPEKARTLLMHRINTKQAAKEFAIETGYRGLRWSEEVDLDGKAAGPTRIYNFKNGSFSEEWTGRLVKHISSNVMYAIYQYAEITGDTSIIDQNLDFFIEIARFYASIVEWSESDQIYHINHVIGMDEYHIDVNNNYFTNYFAKWCLEQTLLLENKFPDEVTAFGLTQEELAGWQHIVKHLKEPNVNSDGVIEEFDGYFEMRDKLVLYQNGKPIMDEELFQQVQNFSGDNSKIIKQCDVVMVMAMLRDRFSEKEKITNFQYYNPRTMHESSLSATYAGIAAADINDIELAKYFMNYSARFNLDFEPKEKYNNGLHLASYAGAWLIMMYGLLGLRYETERITLQPKLPKKWNGLITVIQWRGQPFRIEVGRRSVTIIKESGFGSQNVMVNGTTLELQDRQSFTANIEDIISICN